MTVFTIGYEGLTIDAFLALLAGYGVETVVDIRELPLSRKRGFSKNALAQQLAATGHKYVHMAALGCPRPVRNAYRSHGDWSLYTHGFLKHLHTQGAAVVELAKLAADSNCALLCYEANHNFCHRSLVADAVAKHSGAGIQHIPINPRKANTAQDRLAFA